MPTALSPLSPLSPADPEGQDGPSSPERVLKLFNMAVNSWLHTNVGSEYDATQVCLETGP